MAYKRTYNPSQFEWDAAKAAENREKHGVGFSEACVTLADPLARTMEDSTAQGERRWVSLGMDSEARVLVVVYTWRGPRIRLISARLATSRERRAYEQHPKGEK